MLEKYLRVKSHVIQSSELFLQLLFFRGADGLYEPYSIMFAIEIADFFHQTMFENMRFWSGFSNQNWNGSFFGMLNSVKAEGPWCGGEPNNKARNENCVLWRGRDKCFEDYPCTHTDEFSGVCVKLFPNEFV